MNVIVAVTGASGSIYAKLLIGELNLLKSKGQIERIGVVFSEKAKEVWAHEIGALPECNGFTLYSNDDYTAPFSSGSSLYDVMFVCPCSMGTMGRISCGLADTLITRAADVMLKERRLLILATRETPIHIIHINNMKALTQAGAIIAPASPSFYSHPKSIEDLAMTVVDRLLQLANLRKDTFRWGDIM